MYSLLLISFLVSHALLILAYIDHNFASIISCIRDVIYGGFSHLKADCNEESQAKSDHHSDLYFHDL